MMPFASDALEDAMRLAQTKALNSYTFSDCLNYLNYAWSDIYNRMANIDDGYYGVNVRLTQKLTKLPPYVKNTLQVYHAQSPVGFNRIIYRDAGTSDLTAACVYRISGNELYCPDAVRRTVWLYYIPSCPQIFFTHHNRDPKIYEEHETKRNNIYGINQLEPAHVVKDEHGTIITDDPVNITTASITDMQSITCLRLRNRATQVVEDITDRFTIDSEEGQWLFTYISCQYPYIFVTYQHSITGEYVSGFYDKNFEWTRFNPFDFTGKNSNVEYIATDWNDKTGMGVVVNDHNDLDDNGKPVIKELGWTPDTMLNYPAPEMYRYLVARLADKFSALNESNIMGVQKELVEARYAFEAFLDKDKSAWKRIENVNPANLTDWI